MPKKQRKPRTTHTIDERIESQLLKVSDLMAKRAKKNLCKGSKADKYAKSNALQMLDEIVKSMKKLRKAIKKI